MSLKYVKSTYSGYIYEILRWGRASGAAFNKAQEKKRKEMQMMDEGL